MVLAHAGHGNYLGLHSSLTDDGAAGHDLRPDHEALFMHVAAVGTTATLLGTTAALPGAWPADVDRDPFLHRAVELATEVAAAALPLIVSAPPVVPPPSGRKTSSRHPHARHRWRVRRRY
jgi:hypothetical protein